MRNIVRKFLNGFTNDPNLLKSITVTPELLQALYDSLNEDGRNYSVAIIYNKPQIPVYTVSYYIDNGIINRPTTIKQVKDEYWVGSMNQKIARFDKNWSFLGWVGIWGNPFSRDNKNMYSHVRSFDIDLENDRIAICMESKQCIKVFKLSTWELLYQIGDGRAGNVEDNRLWSPYDVLFYDNYLLVCSYNGYGENGTNHGHVSLYDISNGKFIKTLLNRTDKKYPWFYEAQNPARMFIYENKLYVTYYTLHCIGVFDIKQTEFGIDLEFDTCYFKPKGIDANGLYPRGIYVTDNEIILTLQGPRIVCVLDKVTHDLKAILGTPKWEDRGSIDYTPNVLWDIWDIIPWNDGFAVADYGNNRISYIPRDQYITIPYKLDKELPKDCKIDKKLIRYDIDLENKKIIIPVCKINSIKQNFVIPYTLD